MALAHAAPGGHDLVWLPTYLIGEALRSGRPVSVLDDYAAPLDLVARDPDLLYKPDRSIFYYYFTLRQEAF